MTTEVAPRLQESTALTILVIIALIYLLFFARAILFPIALAFVLFFLFSPVVRFMSRFRIPESIGAAIVVLAATLGIGIAVYVLISPASNWIASAPETFRLAEQELRFLIEPLDEMDRATDEVADLATKDKDGVLKVAIQQPPVTDYLLNATVNVLAGAGITIVLTYLLLAVGHRTLNSIVELTPTFQDKRGVVELMRNIEGGISSYLVQVSIINAFLGLCVGTALGILGLPDPVLIGIMVAALNFIPYLGGIVGMVVTFLIGVVYLETPTQMLLVPAIYALINAIEGNVITPLVLGRSMKLNPAIVFFFIIFWGWVWGIGGILISVPLLGMIKITCDQYEPLQPIARILAG